MLTTFFNNNTFIMAVLFCNGVKRRVCNIDPLAWLHKKDVMSCYGGIFCSRASCCHKWKPGYCVEAFKYLKLSLFSL